MAWVTTPSAAGVRGGRRCLRALTNSPDTRGATARDPRVLCTVNLESLSGRADAARDQRSDRSWLMGDAASQAGTRVVSRLTAERLTPGAAICRPSDREFANTRREYRSRPERRRGRLGRRGSDTPAGRTWSICEAYRPTESNPGRTNDLESSSIPRARPVEVPLRSGDGLGKRERKTGGARVDLDVGGGARNVGHDWHDRRVVLGGRATEQANR